MKYRVSAILDAALMGPVVELLAPYGAVNVKLVEENGGPGRRIVPGRVEGAIPSYRSKTGRRVTVFAPNKGMGTIIALRAVAKHASLKEIRAALAAGGLSGNGSGASLSKLRRNGYIRRESEGVWRITAKGESALRRIEGFETPAHVEIEHDSVESN